jgi:methionine synthase I (cobalamin-dependent)
MTGWPISGWTIYHALHLRALAEAHEARAEAGRGLIAGSMGPLGESYRPDLTPPVAVSTALYAEKAAILAPHVDVILIETISSLDLCRGRADRRAGGGAAGLAVGLGR